MKNLLFFTFIALFFACKENSTPSKTVKEDSAIKVDSAVKTATAVKVDSTIKTVTAVKVDSAIKTTAVTQTDPYLAGVHFMGNAKIGMSKAALLKFYPKLKAETITMESELPCWTIMDTDGKPLFRAIHTDEKRDTITYLISDHPKMHTAEGIKVGSDYKDLKKAFPDITITFAEGYIAHSKAKSMSFGIMGDFETRETKDGNFQVVKVKQGTVQSLEFD